MFDAKIDEKAANAYLRNNLVPTLLEDGSDRTLEVVGRLVTAVVCLLQNAGTGKDQVLLQCADAPWTAGSGLDAFGVKRAENNRSLLGPCEQHVETAMTAWAVDRAEALILISSRVGPVGRRYENHVPFIALDILKVFNEQGFLSARHLLLVGDRGRIVSELSIEQLFNKLSLVKIERHNAQRLIGMLAHVFEGSFDHYRCLARISAVLKDAIGYEMILHPEGWIVVIRGWEDDQVALVELIV